MDRITVNQAVSGLWYWRRHAVTGLVVATALGFPTAKAAKSDALMMQRDTWNFEVIVHERKFPNVEPSKEVAVWEEPLFPVLDR